MASVVPRPMIVAVPLALLWFGAAGCGKSSLNQTTAPSSFAVEPFAEGYRLGVKESALGKLFLLDTGYMEARPSLLSYALDPLIVRFEKRGENLALFVDESMAQMQRPGVASAQLVAEFPIEATSGDQLLIDFDAGMRAAVQANLGSGIAPGATLTASHIDKAYVKDGTVFMDQTVEIAQAPADPKAKDAATPPGQFQYTLRAYDQVADFVPFEGTELLAQRRAGFFLNPGIFKDDAADSYAYAKRWDIREPIVWSIAANAPAEVHDAIRDGILYWNKVLGSEVLQVSDAPAGITPNEPGYNLIQWINNDAINFAYAQFRSDPLTGRTYQAYVMLPSSWYVAGIDSFGTKIASVERSRFTVPARRGAQICSHAPNPMQMKGMLGGLLQGGADDEAVRRASLDLLTTVVAHEVGHTMGLRHNFTAKTALDAKPDAYLAGIATYLKSGDPGSSVYASSVMDYSPLELDAAVGAQIRSGSYVGAYDHAALAWAYGGQATADTDGGLFCTDEDTALSVNVECERFAQPGRPGLVALETLKNLGRGAAAALAAKFIAAKAPIGGPGISPEYVTLTPADDAAQLLSRELSALNRVLFEAEGSPAVFLEIARKFKTIDDLNSDDFKKAESAHQNDLIKAMGGIKAVFAPFVPKLQADKTFSSAAMAPGLAEFNRIVDLASYRAGTSSTKQAYSFSDADIAHMKAVAPKYFRLFEAAALKQLISAFTSANFAADGAPTTAVINYPFALSSTDLGKSLVEFATAIITADDTERFKAKIGTVEIDVAKSYFPKDIQTAALSLFSHDLFILGGKTFNSGASADVHKALVDRKAALVGGDETVVEKLPLEIFREWGNTSALISALEAVDAPAP